MIGARRHHNRILPGAVHPNGRDARRLRARGVDRADVHSGGRQAGLEMIGEQIVTDAPNHPDARRRSRQFRRRAGLIGAFAPRDHLEVAAQRRLPRRGQAVDGNHKIHVEAADNHDGAGHLAIAMPIFLSSSA